MVCLHPSCPSGRNGLAGGRERSQLPLAERSWPPLRASARLVSKRRDGVWSADEKCLDRFDAAIEEFVQGLGRVDGELERLGRGAEDRHAIGTFAAGARSSTREADVKSHLLCAPPKNGLVAPDPELELLLIGNDHSDRSVGETQNYVASLLTGHNCLLFQDSLAFRCGLQGIIHCMSIIDGRSIF